MTRALDTKRPTPVTSGLDSIRADELLPLPVLGQRFGLAKKSLILAQRQGLRTVKFGHRKYAFGRDVLAWFDRLAEKQTATGSDSGIGEGFSE
jgi:hypothetical protein